VHCSVVGLYPADSPPGIPQVLDGMLDLAYNQQYLLIVK